MEGYLVIDNVSLEEAEKIMAKLKKNGRWLTEKAMAKSNDAYIFAAVTHGFPAVQEHELVEFKDGKKVKSQK